MFEVGTGSGGDDGWEGEARVVSRELPDNRGESAEGEVCRETRYAKSVIEDDTSDGG